MRLRGLCLLSLLVISSTTSAEDFVWQEVELRGLYIFGHATSTITPCSRVRPIWLDGIGQGSDDLHAAYDSSGRAHFEPLYVVVRGRLDAEFDTGDYFLGGSKLKSWSTSLRIRM